MSRETFAGQCSGKIRGRSLINLASRVPPLFPPRIYHSRILEGGFPLNPEKVREQTSRADRVAEATEARDAARATSGPDSVYIESRISPGWKEYRGALEARHEPAQDIATLRRADFLHPGHSQSKAIACL